MLFERHDLQHELPEYSQAIDNLKASDPHFARLYVEYDALNEEIIKVEGGVEPMDGFALEDLKKRRLKLKDELYGMLKAHVEDNKGGG